MVETDCRVRSSLLLLFGERAPFLLNPQFCSCASKGSRCAKHAAHTSLPRHGAPIPSIPYISEPSEGRLLVVMQLGFLLRPSGRLMLLQQSMTLLQSPSLQLFECEGLCEREVSRSCSVPVLFRLLILRFKIPIDSTTQLSWCKQQAVYHAKVPGTAVRVQAFRCRLDVSFVAAGLHERTSQNSKRAVRAYYVQVACSLYGAPTCP